MTLEHKFGANRNQVSCESGRVARRIWRPGGAMPTAFVLVGLIIMGATAIAARAAIVSIAPAMAAVYASVGIPVNLRALTIADVRATVTHETERAGELLVTGEVANLRDRETPVPSLRLTLRGEDGRELYVWTARAPKTRLGARERVTFRARLAAPPAGVREVLVKFATPGNKGSFTESPS
jgi:hypothetical protein